MNTITQLPRNPNLIILCTILALYHSSIGITRDATPISFIFASAQNTNTAQTCSPDDQTCSSTAHSKCQANTKTNCSDKEIEYIDKMTSKSSEERQAQISRLKELLERDEKNMNPALIPWIKDRLNILHTLEGLDTNGVSEGTTDTQSADEQPGTDTQQPQNPPRLITPEELAQHTTVENRIWLSILGKVYDVTNGTSFYSPTGGYKFYAGRDASPCFATGQNTPEGAGEALEEWEGKKLMAVMEWSQFYEKHEVYVYLGVLAGSKYYDEEGVEREVRRVILEKAKEAKVIADREKEEKKKARLEKKRREKEEREKKKKKWI